MNVICVLSVGTRKQVFGRNARWATACVFVLFGFASGSQLSAIEASRLGNNEVFVTATISLRKYFACHRRCCVSCAKDKTTVMILLGRRNHREVLEYGERRYWDNTHSVVHTLPYMKRAISNNNSKNKYLI